MSGRLRSAITVCAVLASAACGHSSSDASKTSTSGAAPSSGEQTGTSGPSLYVEHAALLDQDAARIDLDVFRGHPVMISMFYGSCPSACPLLVSNVARVDAMLPRSVRAQTRVLLVSFDPEHDDPPALRSVASRHHVDLARWTLATAPEDDARDLAAALGISFRRLPAGGFAHTSVITALDGEGRIIARAEGPDADVTPVAEALVLAAR